MADLRTILAAVLGVALGVVCLAYPEALIRAQTVGRLPRDTGGEYGETGEVPDRWRLLVRALGVCLLLAGGYFAVSAL